MNKGDGMKTVQTTSNKNPFDWLLGKLNMTPVAFLGLVVLAFLPLIPPFNQQYLIRWLIMGTFIAAGSIAFDFTGGFINIVNFGFHAFVGLGGYTSAILAQRYGLSPWIGLFCGAISAGILGFMLGIVTLRLRGIFAAMITWFVGLALMGLATKMVFLTRGPLGLRANRLFDSASNLPYFYLILFMMLVTYLVTKRVIQSNMGLAFKAIGQNMEAARMSGINPVFYRILNFTLSCTLAGWLGGFYAHYYGILTPDLMHTSKTIEVLAVAYIGGRASLWGGAVVAIPFIFIMELIRSTLSNLPGVNLVLYGLFLVLIMIYYPGGLAQFYQTYLAHPKNRIMRYLMSGKQKTD
jgi:branched-chain amino acid transport system permease protein